MSSNVWGQETTTGPNISEIFCEDIHAIVFVSRPPLRGVLGRGKHGRGVPISRWFAHPHSAIARLYTTCKSWQRCSTSKRLRCQLPTTGMIGPPTWFVANQLPTPSSHPHLSLRGPRRPQRRAGMTSMGEALRLCRPLHGTHQTHVTPGQCRDPSQPSRFHGQLYPSTGSRHVNILLSPDQESARTTNVAYPGLLADGEGAFFFRSTFKIAFILPGHFAA